MNTQVETEEKVTKRQVAKHSLLSNVSGTVAEVENFEEANGLRYIDIASGQTIDYFPKATVNGQEVKLDLGCGALMLGLFGGRTLATNEASAARNGKDASPQEQVDAIQDRLAGIDLGQWVDRTREGGPRIDLPTLATAVVNVLAKEGKVGDGSDAAKATAYGKILAKFEADKAQVSKSRTNAAVDAEYKSLRGAKAATVDDLAGLAG